MLWQFSRSPVVVSSRRETKLLKAVEWQKKALAINPENPTYNDNFQSHLKLLIQVAARTGQPAEAEAFQRELDALDASNAQMATLDARLEAVLGGEAPADDAERLKLADRASAKRMWAASTRLYAEELASNPKIAEDRQAQSRFKAASAAVLAGCGQGRSDPPLDAAAKAKLRQQGREWLVEELTVWKKILDAGTPEQKTNAKATVKFWKIDSDLCYVRDPEELAKLPEEEQAAFGQLWSDVDQLLNKAASR